MNTLICVVLTLVAYGANTHPTFTLLFQDLLKARGLLLPLYRARALCFCRKLSARSADWAVCTRPTL